MAFLFILDQGTTSSRAIVFNKAGASIASVRKEFRQYYLQPGWVEHDPMEIWETRTGVVALTLKHANLLGADIAALGITNQRETTVVWEPATGRPGRGRMEKRWGDQRPYVCGEAVSAEYGRGADRSADQGLKRALERSRNWVES